MLHGVSSPSKRLPGDSPESVSFQAFWAWQERHVALLPAFADVHDGRRAPRIPLPAILFAMLASFLFGWRSVLALDDQLKHNAALRRWLALAGYGASISDDTFADALDALDLRSLQAVLHEFGKRQLARWRCGRWAQSELGRKLARVQAGPLASRAVVAIDGHHLFSCRHPARRCADCTRNHLSGPGNPPAHQIVTAQWVGVHPALVLDFEPVLPEQDGEHGAAARLLERLGRTYGTRIGVIVADALYDYPAFRARVRAAGYRSVVIHKDPVRAPGGEARCALDRRDPARTTPDWKYKDERGHRYEVWEQQAPYHLEARLVATRRTLPDGTVRHRDVVTDLPMAQAPAVAVSILGETRWWIENTGFHELAGPWSLDRAFVHTGRPTAVWAIVCLGLLAYNLLQLYAYRHLRLDPAKPERTLGAIRRDLACTLALFGLRGRPRARSP
jgi:hypothetical protein